MRHGWLRAILENLPGANIVYGTGWSRTHPFDRIHGTDTSGFVSPDELPEHEAARRHAVCYAGSQPSIVRAALAQLTLSQACTFVDLGCGKGRALLVASEFRFRSIIGVELSQPLADIACSNALVIARKFPRRPPMSIVVADAGTFTMPGGDLVVFLYNPFSAEIVARVVEALETAAAKESRNIHVVYYNPVAADCFDASPLFKRCRTGLHAYAREELGYGPDESDTVAVWQSRIAQASLKIHRRLPV